MSRLGAIEGLTAAPASATIRQETESFLPDFCQPRMVFAVVLISELLAVVFALVRAADGPFWNDLGRISLFVQWLGLTSAALLCVARPRLARLPVAGVAAGVLVLLMLNTAIFSVLAVELGRAQQALGVEPGLPTSTAGFLLRNEAICVIVTATLLRYFFISHEWRRHVRAETRARIEALQARMRPHFLFNTMNTIAELTRSDPATAERAVEDLADLLRATLKDSERPVRFDDELDLTRVYARIEALRLGDRLRIDWDVDGVPGGARVPRLTIQPLLENAIYHGIEPLPDGGDVTVRGRVERGQLVFTLANPVGAEAASRPGNRQALDNLRERLRLAYGERGGVETERTDGRFIVTVRLPLET
jgi:two-component system sensor histidine kinase AlgZ